MLPEQLYPTTFQIATDYNHDSSAESLFRFALKELVNCAEDERTAIRDEFLSAVRDHDLDVGYEYSGGHGDYPMPLALAIAADSQLLETAIEYGDFEAVADSFSDWIALGIYTSNTSTEADYCTVLYKNPWLVELLEQACDCASSKLWPYNDGIQEGEVESYCESLTARLKNPAKSAKGLQR